MRREAFWLCSRYWGTLSITSSPLRGHLSAPVAICGALALLIAAITPSNATWRPDYAKNPPAIQQWFKSQSPPPAAVARIGISNCCDHADRLMTKFVGRPGGEWAFYPDPACTDAGCKLIQIPDDVIHTDGIHAIDPADENLPEFQQMRREGILFIWQNRVTCFWPPEPAI